ncbi:hypothetical protein [Gordonia alkaliphila]|uniref:Integral membrane protein n=1 Tax=Gordonia alkaliphila TaxID=1053547 RepID=A0ABP8ZDQ2_9ACTN
MSDDAVPTPTASTGRGLPRILEIRTHGVSGTPPEQILARPDAPANRKMIRRLPDSTDTDRGFASVVDSHGDPVAEPGNPHHHVWAYSWGGMTSGGGKKALWALLIPFALINMAYAMLPDQSDAMAARFSRAAMHLLGLALTVLFTVQVSVLAFDVVAYQCLERSEGSACLSNVPGRSLLAGEEFRLSVAATVLLVALLVLIATITRFTRVDEEGLTQAAVGQGLDAAAAGGAAAPPHPPTTLESEDFHDGSPVAAGLRAVHGIAAPTALVLVMTLVHTGGSLGFWWLIPFGMLIALVATVTWVDLYDPAAVRTAMEQPRWRALVRTLGWTFSLTAYIAAAVVAFVYLPDRLAEVQNIASMRATSELVWITVATYAGLCLVLVIAVAFAIRNKSDSWSTFPDSYRPWMRGYAAAVIAALGIALGAGFGAGLAHTFAAIGIRVLGDRTSEGLTLPVTYDALSVMWGLTTVILLIAVVVLLVGYLLVRLGWRARVAFAWQRALSGLGPATPAPRSVRRAWLLAAHHERLPTFLAAFLVAVVVSACAAGVFAMTTSDADHIVGSLKLVGTGVLLAFVVVLGIVIYLSFGTWDLGRTFGRKFGALWDVASFWPREGHPVVPQSYATVVIHDIVTRVERERDADPTRKIVLGGHSQGSLIMYAVVLRLLSRETAHAKHASVAPAADVEVGDTPHFTEPDRWKNLSLLTYGSQLRWIYARAFPAHLNFHSHFHLAEAIGWRWINLIRTTDPVGGSVLSWDVRLRGRAENPPGTEDCFQGTIIAVTPPGRDPWKTQTAPITNENPSRIRFLETGNERWLPDPPPVVEYTFPRGHSNYVRDPAWPRFVQELVDPAVAPVPAPSPVPEADGAD